MLIVTDPAKNYDLTTLAALKAEMGVSDRASDVDLQRFITQASGVIATHCNRVFALETVTETLRKPGWCDVMLSRYPVVEVVSVTDGDRLVAADEFDIDMRTGIIAGIGSRSGHTVVTYKAGYVLPDGLPEGVERACIILAKSYALAGTRDPAVRSEGIDGAGTTEYFSGGGTGMPPEVAGLLELHIKPNGPS